MEEIIEAKRFFCFNYKCYNSLTNSDAKILKIDNVKFKKMNKAKIISVVNQKRGVGKTTTAVNLSTALVAINKKVLLIDLDPQGNLSTGLGIKTKIEKSLFMI